MSVVTMKQLLEAGVHFGHQAKRWNPKMAKYIFTERNGIHVIDLHKSLKKIEEAYEEMRKIAEDGGKVLFVGTKKQAQEAVETEAKRSGQFYVSHRWLGGMLTNYKTIRKRIERLKKLELMEEDGTFQRLPKKEVIKLKREAEKLEKFLGGIKEMDKLPDVLFVIDPKNEKIAVNEAKILGIPVIGVVDTNCDPDEVEFPIPANDDAIPGNDDAIRAVKLLTGTIANAIVEAKQGEQEETETVVEEVVMETEEVSEEVAE